MLGVSEALALGQSLGISAKTLTKVFNSSSARCWSRYVCYSDEIIIIFASMKIRPFFVSDNWELELWSPIPKDTCTQPKAWTRETSRIFGVKLTRRFELGTSKLG